MVSSYGLFARTSEETRETEETKETAKTQFHCNYAQIRNDLQTGDLVLFSGNYPFSRLIRFLSSSSWSHVGLVYRADAEDLVLLWEATVRDGCSGVHLTALSDTLKSYNGRVAIRSRLEPLTQAQLSVLKSFRRRVRDLKFETDYTEMFRAILDFGEKSSYFSSLTKNEENFSTVFCSELIAAALKSIGVLRSDSKSRPANEYSPVDFSDNVNLELNAGDQGWDEPRLIDNGQSD